MHNTTKNAMASVDAGFKVFMKTVPTDVVKSTWQDFVFFVQGNNTSFSPQASSSPVGNPSATPTAMNPIQGGFDSFTSAAGFAASAATLGAASGAAALGSQLPKPPG
jgi:hypothetical protein